MLRSWCHVFCKTMSHWKWNSYVFTYFKWVFSSCRPMGFWKSSVEMGGCPNAWERTTSQPHRLTYALEMDPNLEKWTPWIYYRMLGLRPLVQAELIFFCSIPVWIMSRNCWFNCNLSVWHEPKKMYSNFSPQKTEAGPAIHTQCQVRWLHDCTGIGLFQLRDYFQGNPLEIAIISIGTWQLWVCQARQWVHSQDPYFKSRIGLNNDWIGWIVRTWGFSLKG